jgi:hypothetical protein
MQLKRLSHFQLRDIPMRLAGMCMQHLQVSTAVEKLLRLRHSMISDLHSDLVSCQNDLGAHLSRILLEASTQLRDVGHATDGMLLALCCS